MPIRYAMNHKLPILFLYTINHMSLDARQSSSLSLSSFLLIHYCSSPEHRHTVLNCIDGVPDDGQDKKEDDDDDCYDDVAFDHGWIEDGYVEMAW